MLFRIIIGCIILAACYATFEIASTWRFYSGIRSPDSTYTIRNDGNQTDVIIVEFMNYACGYCRETHRVLVDYASKNPEIRYVVRPVPFANNYAEQAAEIVMAAGLQGKFWEFDEAVATYDAGTPDEKFYRETAALYDVDYDRMMMDSKGKTVQDQLNDNAGIVQKLGLRTTPAFMIGKTVYQPDKALTLTDLISMVAAERAR